MPQIQRQVPMAPERNRRRRHRAAVRTHVWCEGDSMRKSFSMPMAFLAIMMLLLAACNGGGESNAPSEAPESEAAESMAPESEEPEPSEPAEATIKACMVSDTGGIDDNSFNENGWLGMQQAEAELGAEVSFLESRSAEDYARNIDQHIADGCEIIITVGFLLGDATAAAAEANPDTRFAIVDFAYDPAFANVEGLVYSTAEGAMLAGYAAASWSKTGIMGT
ncbi:MAG: BMP family ABC transporter substrate-binding protein, partial [Candidatus Limnocylindria bacterium]